MFVFNSAAVDVPQSSFKYLPLGYIIFFILPRPPSLALHVEASIRNAEYAPESRSRPSKRTFKNLEHLKLMSWTANKPNLTTTASPLVVLPQFQ